jgi:hypothetical protein
MRNGHPECRDRPYFWDVYGGRTRDRTLDLYRVKGTLSPRRLRDADVSVSRREAFQS